MITQLILSITWKVSPGKDAGEGLCLALMPQGIRNLANQLGDTGFSLVHGKTPVRHPKPFSVKQNVLRETALEKTS